MKVPFGNLKAHYHAYKGEIDEAVQRVLDSGYFILGPELSKFEKEFEQYLGSGHVSGCANGTDAIQLALAACDIGLDDEVLVVAHTAVPTICAIRSTGAQPKFVDIDPETYTMCVKDLESKITEKTKAIVPVHLYGQMADMDPIMALAKKHNLKVVEDCAQSTGALYNGRMAGTIGDFGTFSYYPSKNIGAFGDGGAVATGSKENSERLNMLRNYGQSKRYYHDTEGINSRLDEIQAAILSAQLPYLNEWNVRRREIAQRYTEGLRDVVETPVEREGSVHVYHLYVIQTDNRDRLIDYLAEQSVQALIHYPIPAHLQKAYAYLNYKPGSLPNTEKATQRIVSLPMYPELTNDEIDYVIESIRSYFTSSSQEKQNTESPLNAGTQSYEVAAKSGSIS